MSADQFPNQFYVKTFKTGVTEKLCKFTPDRDMELSYVVLTMLKNGTSVGSESMTMKIYSSWDLSKIAIATSDARLLSAIGVANGTSWRGRVRFDFSRIPLREGDDYYLVIQTASYARTAGFYLAAVLDWPDTVYTQGNVDVPGAQIRIIGYHEREETRMPGGEIRLVEVAEGTEVTAPTDVTVPSTTFTAPVRWIAQAGGPVEEVDTNTGAWVQRFSQANAGVEKSIAFVKIPQDYVTGTQIFLYLALYSPSTSGTTNLVATSYLVEQGTDAMSDTTDSYASTNSNITISSPAREYRQITLDLTDSSGEMNGNTVAAGDTIRVELVRTAGTDTEDTRFVPDLSEVQYNG